jgi:cell division topological specificity factor
MSIFDLFRKQQKQTQNTAAIAKERLQIIVAHSRGKNEKLDFMAKLQSELIEVISRYVKIDKDQVRVALERNDECSVLELNITLPEEV